ncbi:hypothetical protein XENOCAPTIV_011529 [Xenoophorus captivus]|uniref:Uncharacterized protein n=1 Tax=Xenoophorus captivus TaxID=1517983 RepID=A0ABV0R882_9TELE
MYTCTAYTLPRSKRSHKLPANPVQCQPRSKLSKTHFLTHQPISDSEEEGDPRERVPTLSPGQYDGTTPWKEFLHRFESCAEANYWSEKTMTVQLKFCLVGAAGAIVHRNPRSSKCDYRHQVDELEIAYGPSDHAAAVAVELRTPCDNQDPTVLRLKGQNREMSIHMRLFELEVCAVLNSGAQRSVLPFHFYNAINPDTRHQLQPSMVETLLGVGPGDVPVLGEAQLAVSINNRQVDVDFLVADIAGTEALLGHPFLTQAGAHLDFGNHRIILSGEEVPYYQTETRPKSHAVRMARTVVVDPGEEYFVKGRVHLGTVAHGDMMLSSTKGFVEKHKVLIARVLFGAQPSKAVPLCLFNPGNEAVTIEERSMVGLMQPA